jgi:hypothetical protein
MSPAGKGKLPQGFKSHIFILRTAARLERGRGKTQIEYLRGLKPSLKTGPIAALESAAPPKIGVFPQPLEAMPFQSIPSKTVPSKNPFQNRL